MNRSTVIISRKWAGPLIKVDVFTVAGDAEATEIAVSMSLPEFMAAVADEVGSPAMMFKAKTLRLALNDAAERVITGMKAETTRVM